MMKTATLNYLSLKQTLLQGSYLPFEVEQNELLVNISAPSAS